MKTRLSRRGGVKCRGDHIVPSYSRFGSEWDRLRSAPSATETFSLSAMESLKGVIFIMINNHKFMF